MGKFVITTRKNGEFQFSLKAGNGQEILASEGYTTKAACLNGVESVKKNSQDDARFDRLESKNGKYYFNLKNLLNLDINFYVFSSYQAVILFVHQLNYDYVLISF